MERKKLKLKDLKVESFVTNVDFPKKLTIMGGGTLDCLNTEVSRCYTLLPTCTTTTGDAITVVGSNCTA